MVHVACSGFPIPVVRYFEALQAAEVSETELGLVGEGSIRRYLREAPKGAVFTVLAPRAIGASFATALKDQRALVDGIADIAKKLAAPAVVFGVPEGWRATKEAVAAAVAFTKALPRGYPFAVLDLPLVNPTTLAAQLDPKRATVAYDALTDGAPRVANFSYVRMLGPAGKRSRYDEAAIKAIAAHARDLSAGVVVFRNQDALVNARALRTALAEREREPAGAPATARKSVRVKKPAPTTERPARRAAARR